MASIKAAIRRLSYASSSGQQKTPSTTSSSPSLSLLPPPPAPPSEEAESHLLSPSAPPALPQTPFVTLYPAYAASPTVPEERKAKDTALLFKFQDATIPSPTTSPKSDPVMLAAYHGSIEDVKYYLRDAGYNARAAHNPYGESLLHLAAASPSPHVLKVIQELVETGEVKVNATDYSRRTPLHVAAGATGPAGVNAPAVVKKLALYDADVNAQDDQGQTPLHIAVAKGHHQVTRMLLYSDALPCVQDKKGRTPLMLAVSRGDLDLVRLLLTHGAAEVSAEVLSSLLQDGLLSKEMETLLRAHAVTAPAEGSSSSSNGSSSSKDDQAEEKEILRFDSPLPLVPEEEEEEDDEAEEAKDPLRFTQELLLPPVVEEGEEEVK